MKKRARLLVVLLIMSLIVSGNISVMAADVEVVTNTEQNISEATDEKDSDVNVKNDESVLNDGEVEDADESGNGIEDSSREEVDSGQEEMITPEETTDLEETTNSDVESNVEKSVGETEPLLALKYRSHIQDIGWQKDVENGELSGTTGLGKHMEAIAISLSDVTSVKDVENVEPQVNGAIEYQSHVSNIGWQSDWTSSGNISGTVGSNLPMEAIKIRLTGTVAEQYDIYYSVHISDYGWLNWASNGAPAGSQGKAKHIEAIRIVLQKKGGNAPENLGSNNASFIKPYIQYSAHVSSYGWMVMQEDGNVAGTTGKAKQMEAIRISLYDQDYSGAIQYRTHSANVGWSSGWSENGIIGGTTGRGLRMEAIQIQLTGNMAEYYDVYYRTHISGFGWLGWTKNGEVSGSVGYAAAIEAIQIQLFPKGATNCPSTEQRCYLAADKIGTISYGTYVQDSGWQEDVSNGKESGTTGLNKRTEAIHVNVNNVENGYLGGVQYRVHVSGDGWLDWKNSGEDAGESGSGKQIEAIQIKLTDELLKYADIYYQAHIDNYGWLGWAKNGQIAGSSGIGYKLQAIRIRIVPKGTAAPGSVSGYYTDVPFRRLLSSFSTISTNNANGTYNMARALSCFNGVVIQPGQTLSFNGTTGYCGQANGYLLAGVVGGLGYGGGICQASTTLYGAAIRAGLTVIERKNHTISSTYVPRGLDAMVDWGSSDLKLRNDLGYPVTIVTRTVGNVLTAEMYGSHASWYDNIQIECWPTGAHSASARRVYYKNGVAVSIGALPDSYYLN